MAAEHTDQLGFIPSWARGLMRRHHWLLVGAAAILVAGWLFWNVLLVESEVPAPAVTAPGGAKP